MIGSYAFGGTRPRQGYARRMARSTPPTLGELIRRQREINELSMRQLARMVGISNPYLSQIERGLRDPSERVLEAIAHQLEVSAETLYEQAGLGKQDEQAESDLVAAIRDDANLTARQRQSLIEIYDAFVAENGGPRPRRRARRKQ
jgi:transcriptional regulator with XRE-family HTH domain